MSETPDESIATEGNEDQELFVFSSEKVNQLYLGLQVNPNDVSLWNLFFNQTQLCNVEEAKKIFDLFFEKFPYSGRHLGQYAQWEIKRKNYEVVEDLFKEKLFLCPNIEFWKVYLLYMIKKKKEEAEGSDGIKTDEFKDGMLSIYRFVLDHMGLDIASSSIWHEYIEFLKTNWDTKGDPKEEGRKMEAIRKAYQKVIVIPIMNVEQFWKEYNLYENSLNKITAKKILDDKSNAYMNARAGLKERKSLLDRISLNNLPLPVCNSTEEQQQLNAWRKYIDWEKLNSFKLEESVLVQRVLFAYSQAVLNLYHFPQCWYDYARFLIEKKMPKEAEEVFERGIKAMPSCLLLSFSFADLVERNSDLDKCNKIYSELLERQGNDEVGSKNASLVYIQYMRFAMRSKGAGDARDVFKRALKDDRTGYQVFVVHALMEYSHSKNTKTPSKIFEKGLKGIHSFFNEPNYIFAYVDFLIAINELNNVRVLFERLITMISDKKVLRIVWKRFHDFEVEYGAIDQQMSVEARWNDAFEYDGGIDCLSIESLLSRYSYGDLYPCSVAELRSIGYVLKGEKESEMVTEKNARSTDVPTAKTSKFVRPNFRQLVPYKIESASSLVSSGTPNTYQGIIVPDSVALVMRRLPPPQCFQGPYAPLDNLLVMIKQMVLPATHPRVRGGRLGNVGKGGNTSGQSYRNEQSSGSYSNDKSNNEGSGGRRGAKRNFAETEGPSKPVNTVDAAPVKDIFRQRQSKRMNI
eukprot:Nk52_evm3s442 gene=Nk52_evmTU3s442